MANPSELLTPEQQKACSIVGVSLEEIDGKFWERIRKIQMDALLKQASILLTLKPEIIPELTDEVEKRIEDAIQEHQE